MISLTPPPPNFTKTNHGLMVYWQATQWQVFDIDGFVCSCNDPSELDRILEAEANGTSHRPDGTIPKYYWAGAREYVDPGAADRRVETMTRQWNLNPPPEPSPLVGKSASEVLAALGLSVPPAD